MKPEPREEFPLPRLELVPPAATPARPELSRTDGSQLEAQREHVLLALVELTQELAGLQDPYGLADLALLNLMGQIRTSKAALWLIPSEGPANPVLVRCHGVPKPWARAVGTVFDKPGIRQAIETSGLMAAAEMGEKLGAGDRKLIEESKLALFAPIAARGSVSGFIGLGSRIGGAAYQPIEYEVLQGSLGILGVSLENTRLYNNLKEMNRQLRQAADDLQELDRLKSEFISNVNHELRTPLTIISAYLELLLTDDADSRRRKEFLEVMLGESRKLLSLFEKLLDFSSVSKEGLEINLQTTSLAPFLADFHQERLPGMVDGMREFRLRLGESIPRCHCDPQRLGQILGAILDNAVKFTPRGSCITLCGSPLEEGGTRWAKIDLVDDGLGIPPDRLANLFEAFRQGDGSSTRVAGGMGIGLALAKKLAEQMGGDLRIVSVVGHGSTFSVLLRAV